MGINTIALWVTDGKLIATPPPRKFVRFKVEMDIDEKGPKIPPNSLSDLSFPNVSSLSWTADNKLFEVI